MTDFLDAQVVAALIAVIVGGYIISVNMLRTPHDKDYNEQVSNYDPYEDHHWTPSPPDIGYVLPALRPITSNGNEFIITNRDPWKYDRVPTVGEHDAATLDIEAVDTFVSYTELMGRLRAGTMQPKDMPPTLPVTFEMLMSMVMAMIDTNERKGDAKTCDRVFTLLRRKYDAVSLNAVPEARYLELWVDLKGLERLRG